MSIVVLVGSSRADSWNQRLARAALTHLPPDSSAVVWPDLAALPFYDADLDRQDAPEAARRLRDTVADADSVLVVTPEYNGGPSAVLLNAIDWLSRPRGEHALAGKSAAVLAATPSPRAAQWAREHLARVLTVAGATLVGDTVGVGTAPQAFDGDRLTDPELDARVAGLVRRLAEMDSAAA